MKLTLRSLTGGLVALGWLTVVGCSSEGGNGSGGPACSDIPRGVGYVSSNGAAALTVFQLAKVKAALGR